MRLRSNGHKQASLPVEYVNTHYYILGLLGLKGTRHYKTIVKRGHILMEIWGYSRLWYTWTVYGNLEGFQFLQTVPHHSTYRYWENYFHGTVWWNQELHIFQAHQSINDSIKTTTSTGIRNDVGVSHKAGQLVPVYKVYIYVNIHGLQVCYHALWGMSVSLNLTWVP